MMRRLLFTTLSYLLITIGNGSLAQIVKSVDDNKIGKEIKGGLEILRNIRYAARPDSFDTDTSSDRLLDLYRPQSAWGKLPVILFIHGGGFSGGDKIGTEAICTKLSSLGYAVLSINYRLESKRKKVVGGSASANTRKFLPINARFHESFRNAISSASEDTELALQWIKRNASVYNLKTSSVALAGGSAGGITALHTAYASDQKVIPVKAVINLWGAMENVEIIKKNAPPVLTFHGDKDLLVHVDYAYAIHKQMKEIGNQLSELHIMSGKGHARYDIVANEKTAVMDVFLKKAFKR